jgi:cell filamentation protein
MSKYAADDACVDPEHGILKNKLYITDETELEKAESSFALARSFALSQKTLLPPYTPDTLKWIHGFLFGDIYEWAGHFRTVDIAKGTARFANIHHIESSLSKLFQALAQDGFLLNLDKESFCKKAAYYMGELNAIHPFREGNGRTQREFITLLAKNNGWSLLWKNMTAEAILQATIESFRGDYTKLEQIISENLQ